MFIFLRVQLRQSKNYACSRNVSPPSTLSTGQSDPDSIDPHAQETNNIFFTCFLFFNDGVNMVGSSTSSISSSPIINFYTNDANIDTENNMIASQETTCSLKFVMDKLNFIFNL